MIEGSYQIVAIGAYFLTYSERVRSQSNGPLYYGVVDMGKMKL